VVKSVRSFNASDDVNILIEQEAPKGKGFSAWVNGKILEGQNAKTNSIELKSEVTDIGVEI